MISESLDASQHAPHPVTGYRWGFIGSAAGSAAWMLSLLYAVQNTPSAVRLSLVIAGSLVAVLAIDFLIWHWFSRRPVQSRQTFSIVVTGALVATSIAAVVLELTCRPMFVRDQLQVESLFWVPRVAGLCLLFILMQFSLAANSAHSQPGSTRT
ncbi:MAG: hypothetical protein V4719_06315, partial [Planctomycetota bacterium]